MMKKILAALALLLFSIGSNAQFTNGQVLTAQALNAALGSPTIVGGSINNAPVGQTTPAAGTFTNVVVTGTLTAPISIANLSAQAANTVVANVTASLAVPTAVSLPSCSTSNSALKYTSGTGFVCGTTFALTTGNLSQFASTTSAQLAGVISDGTGSGSLVFGTNPTITGSTLTGGSGSFTTLAASSTVSGVGFTNLFASPPAIGGTAANTGSFTTLNASSTVSGTGITSLFASPPPVGSTAASTGAFTNLSSSGTVSGTGFSSYLASPPAIGGTAPAAGTFVNLASTGTFTPAQVAGIVGTTTNNNAQAGSWGEYQSVSVAPGSAVSVSSATNTNIMSFVLGAGDWDVEGNVGFTVSAGAVGFVGCISTISGACGSANTGGVFSISEASTGTFGTSNWAIPTIRISLTGNTTIIMVANSTFSSGTVAVFGLLRARRVR